MAFSVVLGPGANSMTPAEKADAIIEMMNDMRSVAKNNELSVDAYSELGLLLALTEQGILPHRYLLIGEPDTEEKT